MEVGSVSGNAFLEVAVTMSLNKAISLSDESSSFVVRLLAICRLATKEIVNVFFCLQFPLTYRVEIYQALLLVFSMKKGCVENVFFLVFHPRE